MNAIAVAFQNGFVDFGEVARMGSSVPNVRMWVGCLDTMYAVV